MAYTGWAHFSSCFVMLLLSFQVSIAAMKSFHSIVDPQGAAKTSPRSSTANLDAMPTERSHDRSPDPASSTLEPPGGVSQEQNTVIWTKAVYSADRTAQLKFGVNKIG